MSHVPRIPRALLRLILSHDLVRTLLPDLDAEFEEIARTEGRSRARRWYWKQTRWALWPVLSQRFRPRVTSAPVESSQRWFVSAQRVPERLVTGLGLAGRRLMKQPGVTLTIVITLAIGIAVNTTVFSVVDQVLMRPLPYGSPERLAILRVDRPSAAHHPLVSGAEVAAIRNAPSVLDAAAVTTEFHVRLDGEERSSSLTMVGVTTNFLSVLDVPPLLGRGFTATDLNGSPVAVISWPFWRDHFASDPDIVGADVTMAGRRRTVVGVLPPDFRLFLGEGTGVSQHVDVFTPAPVSPGNATFATFRAVVRLRDGATIDRTRGELADMATTLAREHPEALSAERRTYHLISIHEDVTGPLRPAFTALIVVTAIVLGVACLNAAGLLLARAVDREAEFALRAALGASRRRLVAHVWSEVSLLTVGAAVVGAGAAIWLLNALPLLDGIDIPRLNAIEPDRGMLVVSIALAAAVALGFGLLPAMHASRSSPGDVLRVGSSRTTPRIGVRTTLIVVQIAAGFFLLLGAGLMAATIRALNAVELGYEPESVITATLVAPFPTGGSDYWRFYDAFRRETLALPGVTHASAVSRTPLQEFSDVEIVRVAADAVNGVVAEDRADLRWVLPEYFATMGTALLAGRGFSANDFEQQQPVVIVDDHLARRLWPGRSALGQTLYVPATYGGDAERATVVGVVQHARLNSIRADGRTQVYRPASLAGFGIMTIVARTEAESAGLFPLLRDAADRLGARNFYGEQELRAIVAEATQGTRLAAMFIGVLALIAVASASLGLYSLLAFAVARRRREAGIRLALGATPGRIVRLHVRHGFDVTVSGIAVGSVAAVLAGRAVESLLFGVAPAEPVVWIGAAVVFLGVAFLASYFPSRAAGRVDPADPLRAP